MEDIITSQTKSIEKHLREGKTITPIEALSLYGCFRLGARIFDLKDQGLDIATQMIKDGRKRYAQYSLNQPAAV
ncbi:MAG TPA: helix-turn-helix domain-containing protein [Saprospiraceae bacterium]|nr:helix-turn-helix domain-containing protein [Saprospiraceae bacterium]HMU05893.1 helix-turn-helix domain-containing protein [Saprospiraceae bacterium]